MDANTWIPGNNLLITLGLGVAILYQNKKLTTLNRKLGLKNQSLSAIDNEKRTMLFEIHDSMRLMINEAKDVSIEDSFISSD